MSGSTPTPSQFVPVIGLIARPFGNQMPKCSVMPRPVAPSTTVSVPNGSLSINALPWADVWIDGRSVGTTPLGNLSVPVGIHEIVWRHPELGLLMPDRFISIAEETGAIVPIGYWTLKRVCERARRWSDQGMPLSVAVNLCAIQFHDPELVPRLGEILRATGAGAQMLELEITESMVMKDPDAAVAVMDAVPVGTAVPVAVGDATREGVAGGVAVGLAPDVGAETATVAVPVAPTVAVMVGAAIVAVTDGVCGVCQSPPPSSDTEALRQGAVAACVVCEQLLYLPRDGR